MTARPLRFARRRLFVLIATYVLLGTATVTTSAPPPEDALDRALAHVGLSKATARFEYGDMDNYGGGEFQLPFFRALHGDPYKIPAYAQAISGQLRSDAKTLAPLIAFGTARVGELVRRGLVGNPLDDAEKKAAAGDALVQAIVAVCEKGGSPLGDEAKERLRKETAAVPVAMAKPAALILYASIRAFDWRQRAFAKAAQKLDLQKLFTKLFSDVEKEALDPEMFELMHLVDLKALFAGAEELAMALDKAVPELAKVADPGAFAFRWQTPWGWVEINGSGNDTYPAGVKRLLTIDASGDDVYEGGGATQGIDNPISILIDLKGNDIYKSESKTGPSFGAGIMGYGFLIDLAGNDTYTAINYSQGCGAFGVGCLLDLDGDDRYSARSYAQGSGFFGIGILSDIAGKDRYEGFTQIQGFGYTKGLGLLIDLAGNDTYIANDTKIDFPSAQTAQHNNSLAQGCGTGYRADYIDGHSLAGGVGILFDAAGDDTYSAGLFAQGVGYWYGVGMLIDDGGNDSYDGVWYVQGSAAHFAVGILIDGGGDDHYRATMNMAQGAGHDFSLGFLLDKAGNDHYESPSLSLGAGNANGIGIFWDMAGDDTYDVKGGISMGAANYEPVGLRSAMLCLGVFVDGGGNDRYPKAVPATGNSKVWIQPVPKGAPPTVKLKGIGLDE